MRLFQTCGLYRTYVDRFEQLTASPQTFVSKRDAFLSDRFGAPHFLEPVLNGSPDAFFTVGDRESLQRSWAVEQGMPAATTLTEILLAQVESHRTEVFYSLDPAQFGAELPSKLPGCVKLAAAWRAAPSSSIDLGHYDVLLCNFPSILASYRERGWRAEFFSPAHDPEMDRYAARTQRQIDVLFVGGFSRYHQKRAEVLEAVASLADRWTVRFCLDTSRLTRLAETPLGLLPPLRRHRRPGSIRRVSAAPVFGRDLYGALSESKIVLNGAVDMAGNDRGNMRCFEALGCGALMVSDTGGYPDGWVNMETMLTYRDAAEAGSVIDSILKNPELIAQIAGQGHSMVRSHYSKAFQWSNFQDLVAKACRQ